MKHPKWIQRLLVLLGALSGILCLHRVRTASKPRKGVVDESFIRRYAVGKFAQNDDSMSDYCINLELPTYLREWLIHENGGKLPIEFPRLSTENKILETFLIKTPYSAIPDFATDFTLPIAIPYFRVKHPKTYHYLPRKARELLAKCIRNRFIIQLWNDLHRHGNIGKRKDYLIEDWMKEHGIELTETNWNAIAKIYQRQHRNYLARQRYKKKFKK